MPAQLSFAGFDTPPQPQHRYFFALFPDADTAARMAALAERLREEAGLKGRAVAPERLHVTLHHLGDHAEVRKDIIGAAREIGEAVSAQPFAIAFDRIGSFKGRPGNLPLVLRGGDGVAGAVAFQRSLGAAMVKGGLRRWAESNFVPHVTLLYDGLAIDDRPVEPIVWTARELVLVHSLLGETRHIPLARWPLRPGDME